MRLAYLHFNTRNTFILVYSNSTAMQNVSPFQQTWLPCMSINYSRLNACGMGTHVDFTERTAYLYVELNFTTAYIPDLSFVKVK